MVLGVRARERERGRADNIVRHGTSIGPPETSGWIPYPNMLQNQEVFEFGVRECWLATRCWSVTYSCRRPQVPISFHY